MTLRGAEIRFTVRAHGDVAPTSPGGEARRRAVVDLPWTCLHQVHGSRVVVVDAPGACTGEDADAAVTTVADAALAVFTADCAPVVLAGDDVLAVVHAGWRGLHDGVVQAAVARMRSLGAERIDAALGPCIHAECYEFSPADLDAVAARFGDDVRGTTSAGRPALDVPAAVRAALRQADVELVHDEDVCTACTLDRHFSHRARGEVERQATVAWMPRS